MPASMIHPAQPPSKLLSLPNTSHTNGSWLDIAHKLRLLRRHLICFHGLIFTAARRPHNFLILQVCDITTLPAKSGPISPTTTLFFYFDCCQRPRDPTAVSPITTKHQTRTDLHTPTYSDSCAREICKCATTPPSSAGMDIARTLSMLVHRLGRADSSTRWWPHHYIKLHQV